MATQDVFDENPESALDDESYSSIPINLIVPDSPLPCDIYLFVSGHFIRFKYAGDTIPPEKYNNFLLSRISHLFTKGVEIQKVREWSKTELEKSKQETLERVGEEHADMVALNEAIKRDVLGIFSKEITNKDAREVYNKATEFVKKIGDTKEAQSALRRLLGYSKTLADHSVNVANLSMYLSIYLNYANQTILKNIYLGALYHDIGKTKIDPSLSEESNPKAYQKAIKAHPELGKTLLLSKTDLPEEVLRIVGEHHEQNDGRGFPKKLNGARIFDLTKIVSIANFFDNQVSIAEGDLRKKQRYALEQLKLDKGHSFDPKKLEKVIEAISLGV